MSDHGLRGLYAITPDELTLPGMLAKVQAALDGGVRIVQYRNKLVAADVRKEQARALLAACHLAGAKLIVNDDVRLAIEIGADGVHIGRDDAPGGSVAAVREALGTERILGVSCYNDHGQAVVAAQAGADYLAVGSVFASATKPAAVRASLDFVTRVKQEFRLPVCAIGGITLANGPLVIGAGADMLAVISSLFDAGDIRHQAQQFQNLFH